jgi:excisionase family DNA binding protein
MSAIAPRPTVWHTYRSAAEYTQVRPITLKRAVDAGKLRAFRLQRAVRFRAEDLDAWLSANPIGVR